MLKTHQVKQPVQLYPGEINDLADLAAILGSTRRLLDKELERIKKLQPNPTFPSEAFAKTLGEIQREARFLAIAAQTTETGGVE